MRISTKTRHVYVYVLCNCMQAHGPACKLIDLHLHAFWNILEHSAFILKHSEHSACILEHTGTFCVHFVTFWNILHAFCNILEHSGTFWM